MQCPTCQRENLPDSLFCTECGAKIEVSCAACSGTNPPSAKFCRRCGVSLQGPGAAGPGPVANASLHPLYPDARSYTPKHLADKILQSKSALEGERKQVTVLFADVKGSMELAEQLDPEEWSQIMQRFFQILADGVERFEGFVDKFTGDGIMALFGAPIAHEDHAQRACYAALHLRDALRQYADALRIQKALNFSVRMGLNSGEVVVGRIGDDLRMDYTAQGHTVGLAARMEQLAEPGRVYVTESTARLVSGQFVLRDLGRAAIKGASDPVGVYEIEAAGPARTRLEVARTKGLTRFVGRSAETTLLDTALTRATSGEAQIVGVVGEAGVGKSRLCVEFIERCRARAVPVYEAHCLSHGAALPFYPIVQLLRAVFGVREHDAPEAARRTIAGTVVLLDDRLREALPLVFDFLGVPDPERPLPRMEPEARQRQLLDFATALVRARSARQPAVLLIDDLHWIDAASDALLAGFLAAVVGSRTLLLLNFRPEYTREWMSRADYQQIALRPLGPEATAELLTVLLGADASLAPVTALVAARAGGNPFFAEEIVHALVEQGVLAGVRGAYRLVRPVGEPVGEVIIPLTVQAILAARIDRLSERDKSVIQTAAIIGKEFSEPLLQRVVACPAAELSAALAALVRGEFIVERALYPEREYAFRHPLTQEVVYRSQLSERRAAVHAAVARALEVIHATQLGEHAALLAHHWEAAGDAVAAARWHRRAARWIGARDRTLEMRHWQQVRALLDGTPESPETLVRRVTARIQMIHAGMSAGLDDAEASALFTEAMRLAEQLGQVGLQVWLLAEHSMGRATAGHLDEGLRHLQAGLDLADRAGNALDRFAIRVPGPRLLTWAGRLGEAVAMSQEIETLSGGDPELAASLIGFSPLGLTLIERARALAPMGRLRDAWDAVAAATAIGQAREDRVVLAGADETRAEISYFAGDSAQARAAASRASAFGFGERFPIPIVLGEAYVLNGQWPEAIETLTQSLDRGRKWHVALPNEAWALALLAEAYAGAGDAARARESAEQAVDCARQRQVPVWEIHALLARARVLRMTDGAASAPRIADDLRAAEALITRTEAHAYTPFVHEERAQLARLVGDAATCQRELHEAHQLFSAMGATGHAERLATELGL